MKCRNPGCSFMDLLDRLAIHESYCHKREVPCPSSLTHQCSWRGLLTELADHIQGEKCCILSAHPPMYLVRNKDEIVFSGSLMNTTGYNFFEQRRLQTLKPIILRNSAIYRMWAFLQIERSYNGRWVFQVFCLMTKMDGCKVQIAVRTADGKSFIARHKIPTVESMCQGAAFIKGLCLVLFDSHIRLGDKPKKLFDFQVTIFTNQAFRDGLNYSNLEGEVPLLGDYRDEIFPPLRPPLDTWCHAEVELVSHPVVTVEREPSRSDQAVGVGVVPSTGETSSGEVVEAGPSGNESPSLLETLNQNSNDQDIPAENILQEVVATQGVDGGQSLTEGLDMISSGSGSGTDEDSAGGGEVPGSEEEEDPEEEFSTDGPSSDEGGGTNAMRQ